jgi:hypothetical protein
MPLTRRAKIVLGLLTAWPVCYVFLFFAYTYFWMFAQPPSREMPEFLGLVAAVHLLTAVLMLGLVAFYIVYLLKTPHVEPGRKAVWAVIILLGHGIGMPIFFLMHIWPDRPNVSEARGMP